MESGLAKLLDPEVARSERIAIALERIADALERMSEPREDPPIGLSAVKQADGTWAVEGWDGDPKIAFLDTKRFYSERAAVEAIHEAIRIRARSIQGVENLLGSEEG